MYLIQADRLHGSPLTQRNRKEQVKKQDRVKKRKYHPYAAAFKIRKHHPYEEWLKVVKIWKRQIIEKRRLRMHLQIFKLSDAYRSSYQSSSTSSAYASNDAPRDIDRRNVGASNLIPTTTISYDGY